MRTLRDVSEIRDRIRFLLCQELDRRVLEGAQRKPVLCTHNHRQPLDTRPRVEDAPNETFNRTTGKRGLPVLQTIGLCMLGSESPQDWPGNICEDEIDAKRCPYFDPTRKKSDIHRELTDQVSDLDWLKENLPEVGALYWVLNESEATVRLPWWKRLWFRFLRVRVEPVLPPLDPQRLLPPLT